MKPERWLPTHTAPVPFSYIPFLEGARKCIGRTMAEMQLLIVISVVVSAFNVRVFADAPIPPFMIPRFAAPIPFELRPAGRA
jgi:cytochrome P450